MNQRDLQILTYNDRYTQNDETYTKYYARSEFPGLINCKSYVAETFLNVW